jgi:acetylornithine/succinyldiaminopimelate/putrescine aminotransferase
MDESEQALMFPIKGKLGLTVTRGKGSYLYTSSGQRILDFYTGHGVALLGHGEHEFARALKAQVSRLVFVSTLADHPDRAEAARLLLQFCGPAYSRVFFVNSGAEANEVALKVARKATGRSRVIAFEGGFHGRTHATLSASGLHIYRKTIAPDPSFVILPWGDAGALLAEEPHDVAALLFEPIQGLAGIREAPALFYEALKTYSAATGALLIADEVQSGLGRTGRFLASAHFGLQPHLVTLAKGLGNGVPVAATVARADIAECIAPGDHGSTFGGGPLAMAAVCATLNILRRRDLVARAAHLGEALRDQLATPAAVTEVRGRGLFVAFRTHFSAVKVRDALLNDGVWVGLSEDPEIVRLLPPLTLQEKEIHGFIRGLKRALKALRNEARDSIARPKVVTP